MYSSSSSSVLSDSLPGHHLPGLLPILPSCLGLQVSHLLPTPTQGRLCSVLLGQNVSLMAARLHQASSHCLHHLGAASRSHCPHHLGHVRITIPPTCLKILIWLFRVGIWFESSFGLSNTALGASVIAAGVAELVADISCTFIIDRIGGVLTIAIFLALLLAGCLVTAFTGPTLPLDPLCPPSSGALHLWGAITCLFVMILSWEATWVSSMAVVLDIVPEATKTMISFFTGAMLLGGRTFRLLKNP